MTKRIGLIGFGFIGAELFRLIQGGAYPGLSVAFVQNRSAAALADVPPDLVLHDLADFAKTAPDLIVEAAHPDVTVAHGAAFLEAADYMPFSATALARDDVMAALTASAAKSGRKLLIPSGALIGTDALYLWRHMWQDVTITFRKHPRNIDFALVPERAVGIESETLIYDGPVRGIAGLFPRNVNTMVTCALATVGLDKCRARLFADPNLKHAIAETQAWGKDGSELSTLKRQPAVGVSGSEMFQSALRSILRASDVKATIDFV